MRKERLELSRLSTLEPKSSASTNSATFAKNQFASDSPQLCEARKLGWTMGIEPTTTGITIRGSTN